ncbi:glutamate--tRNA ligase [Candidatus Velamenicoccus archaeovorus]|uniref:glutamate--tRNA ligase n=1 Tax=Velamenicoccus archaeovorus TaxID=1930593 RepID=UPI0013E89C81|nr:glutamate--tRNA ligase [Candidatus Velamenicoccus archaeovorus]
MRFAPSPTGYLHIGGARTCLFNWLYARAQGGSFVLRIEDTDQARSKKEYLEEILFSLKWLGLDWDELHYQSQRFDIYRQVAQKLLDAGLAYKAEDGSGAVIFRMPQKTLEIDDMIHGKITFDTGLIKDQVLIKSDQSPTYNFACVVDDAAMQITHIIRGDDHISNTPKQVVLYEALGYPLPKFAHIPMILGAGGGRMSKRAGATAISEYRSMGFLSGALVNYLMLLGWSPGNNQEIIALKDAIAKFDIQDANKTAATFDMNKLLWLNSQYIKSCPIEELAELVKPFLKERNLISDNNFDGKYLEDVLQLFKERASTLAELSDAMAFFFVKDVAMDPAAAEKFFAQDLNAAFGALRSRFAQLSDFSPPRIEEDFRRTAAEMGLSTKQLIHPLRVALSGKTVGPGMFEMIATLGRDRTLERIERAIQLYKNKSR